VNKLPVRLKADPIIEAVFDVRFESAVPAASEVLSGILYPLFRSEVISAERLIPFDLPPQIVEADPNLKYQPRLRLKGRRYAVLIGDRSLVVASSRPYLGWTEFKPAILTILKAVQNAGIIGRIERHSLKYVNLLPSAGLAEQFSLVRYSSNVGSYDLTKCVSAASFEVRDQGLTNLVELKANARVTGPDGTRLEGLLVSVDSIDLMPGEFWSDCDKRIEKVHHVEKSIFFDLLTDHALAKFQPVWE
jgi:uncharacterized protein (TIGR04255 family)